MQVRRFSLGRGEKKTVTAPSGQISLYSEEDAVDGGYLRALNVDLLNARKLTHRIIYGPSPTGMGITA